MFRFRVPPSTASAVAAELNRATRGRSAPRHLSVFSIFLDTPDHRLANAGVQWRLHHEGQHWIQHLGPAFVLPGPAAPAEHEALVSPLAPPDARRHAGTPLGDRLLRLLGRAGAEVAAPVETFRCDCRRTVQTLRSSTATIEVCLDEGTLSAGPLQQRLCDLEMRLLAGPAEALDALAERWVSRFELIVEPRTLADRGMQLSQGLLHPPLRKARMPVVAGPDRVIAAAAAAMDECVAQFAHNAIGLLEGDPALRVEHVHQLRVGIRRLRCALRCFRGWEHLPPEEAAAGLRSLFTTLGNCRNADVLDSGVAADLQRAGAPTLSWPPAAAALHPADVLRSHSAQRSLRHWLAWRRLMLPNPQPMHDSQSGEAAANPPAAAQPEPGRPVLQAADLSKLAERRLERWHARIVAEALAFDTLDEVALHALRKRIKRQRYAVEFFAPLLRRRCASRYFVPLAALQDRMGELNDLFGAREAYQGRLEQQPEAWFALGWLAARIAQARVDVQQTLLQLTQVDPPRARR